MPNPCLRRWLEPRQRNVSFFIGNFSTGIYLSFTVPSSTYSGLLKHNRHSLFFGSLTAERFLNWIFQNLLVDQAAHWNWHVERRLTCSMVELLPSISDENNKLSLSIKFPRKKLRVNLLFNELMMHLLCLYDLWCDDHQTVLLIWIKIINYCTHLR